MNPDFVDLLRAFVAADVRFLVVGAYALALHGRPRATGDLDVWVDATSENAAAMLVPCPTIIVRAASDAMLRIPTMMLVTYIRPRATNCA